MALRAGYVGIKKRLLDVLKALPKSIEDGFKNQTQLLEDTVGWIGDNKIVYMASHESNGIVFTFDSNTKVTSISGTATANAYQQSSPQHHYTDYPLLPAGRYEVSCDKLMSAGCSLQVLPFTEDGTALDTYNIEGSSKITMVFDVSVYAVPRFRVSSGVTINEKLTAIIKPLPVSSYLENLSSFRKDLIYSGTEWSATMSIGAYDLSDYDAVVIYLGAVSSTDNHIGQGCLYFVDDLPAYVSDSNANDHLLVEEWASTGFSIAFDVTNNAFKAWARNGNAFVIKIYGIKF